MQQNSKKLYEFNGEVKKKIGFYLGLCVGFRAREISRVTGEPVCDVISRRIRDSIRSNKRGVIH